MPWLEVSIRITPDLAEQAAAVLEAQQALAVTTQSANRPSGARIQPDKEIFEPEPGTTPLWSEVEVRGLFENHIERQQVLDALTGELDPISPQQLSWRTVEDQAWERAWMDRFGPMKFGKRLWIVPRDAPSPAGRGTTVIRLDPGLAFGTGAHATTALCMEWIDGQRFTGRSVVDYGCGSGVLAIAAALKGARRVIAVDNDPQALEACAMNARQNHVNGQVMPCAPEHYRALLLDTLRGLDGVDVVICNILARPLVQLAPMLTDSLRTGGRLVLSGLLDSQVDSVRRAYRRAFGKLSVTRRDGWARLDGVKRA